MTELNTEVNEEIQNETQEQTTDLETSAGSDENTDKQDGVQKRINKAVGRQYAAERKAEELQKKLDAVKAQPTEAPKAEQPSGEPNIPDDIYDEEAMKQYHRDMAAHTQKVAQETARSELEAQQQSQAEATRNAQMNGIVEEYAAQGVKDGLTVDQMSINEQTLVRAGVSADLGEHIMRSENGAKIADYLAQHPEELVELAQMSPFSAGERVKQVRAAAMETSPVTSGAPEPAPVINGGGVETATEFDKLCPGAVFK